MLRRRRLRNAGDVHRAMAERIEYARGMRADAVADHQQYGTRCAGSEQTSGFDGVVVWARQFQQHQVGAAARIALERFLAAWRLPQQLISGDAGKQIAQQLAHFDARVDQSESHGCGSPIRSTTACSKVSSWKLPLVR